MKLMISLLMAALLFSSFQYVKAVRAQKELLQERLFQALRAKNFYEELHKTNLLVIEKYEKQVAELKGKAHVRKKKFVVAYKKSSDWANTPVPNDIARLHNDRK